jgi:hypothetical protein
MTLALNTLLTRIRKMGEVYKVREAIGVCQGSLDFKKQANVQDKERPCGQTQQRSKHICSEVTEEEKRSGLEIIAEIGWTESS